MLASSEEAPTSAPQKSDDPAPTCPENDSTFCVGKTGKHAMHWSLVDPKPQSLEKVEVLENVSIDTVDTNWSPGYFQK